MKTPIPILTGLVLPAILLLAGCSGTPSKKTPKPDNEGFIALFDGQTLDGWEYDTLYWRVADSCMVGEVTPETLLKRNTFIIKKDLVLEDFELKVAYRISERGNSGISYRNARIDTLPYALKGYQADIDGRNTYTGQNYEERGREFLAVRGERNTIDSGYVSPPHAAVRAMNLSEDSLSRHIRRDDWNEYHIIAIGANLKHYINGVLMSEVTDNDVQHRRLSGLLGVQVHVGPPMKVEFKNFRVKRLGDTSGKHRK